MTQAVDLPKADSPTLALVHPTEEEKVYQFKLNADEFRGALTVEKYLLREDHLAKQELTRDGGITYWFLVDTAAKQNPLDPSSSIRLPLASCETYRKKALVWKDGKVIETVSHAVGSVFCAQELRRRGYAARMMREVANVLRTWQTAKDEPSLFSVLFSDIGKEFYASLGWEPFESAHVSIPAGLSPPSSGTELPAARPLFAEDLEDLCKIDEALVRKQLEDRPTGSKTAVALVPDVATMRWFHAREDFVGKELHGKTPKVKGAIVGEDGHRVWMYWGRMWYNHDPEESKGNTLYILRVVEEEGSNGEGPDAQHVNGTSTGRHDAAIASLLLLAQREAREWGMEEVQAWNPKPSTLSAFRMVRPDVEVVNRDKESITSLKWYPEHEGRAPDFIDWVDNEKYGWN